MIHPATTAFQIRLPRTIDELSSLIIHDTLLACTFRCSVVYFHDHASRTIARTRRDDESESVNIGGRKIQNLVETHSVYLYISAG